MAGWLSPDSLTLSFLTCTVATFLGEYRIPKKFHIRLVCIRQEEGQCGVGWLYSTEGSTN